jgi:protein SCO1
MSRIVTLLSVVVLLVGCKSESEVKRVLPIYGEREFTEVERDGKIVYDTVFHQIPEFRYQNQDGEWVDNAKVKGRVFVADFFFTSCPSICPKMTSQLKRLQILTEDIPELHFLSFSIDPEVDQPEVLRKYIQEYGVSTRNWDFLTGNEEETHELGVRGFLVHAESDEDAPGGFAHSPSFVLVDRDGLIRGIYDGTSTEDVDQLNKDIRRLLKEEYGADF